VSEGRRVPVGLRETQNNGFNVKSIMKSLAVGWDGVKNKSQTHKLAVKESTLMFIPSRTNYSCLTFLVNFVNIDV
jgi:hypothetical protein